MSVLIAFTTITFAAFLIKERFNLASGSCLFVAVIAVNLLSVAFAMANLLYFGALFIYLAIVTLSAFFWYKNKDLMLHKIKEFINLPVLFTLIAFVFFYLIFNLKKPLFIYWDEFTFWGISAKVTKVYNTLYTVAPALLNAKGAPPGGAVLSYFVQFFSSGFSETNHYLAYTILYISAFAALTEGALVKINKISIAFCAYLLCFFSPFILLYIDFQMRIEWVMKPYMTALVDYGLALVFAATIILYLTNKNKHFYLLGLFYLPYLKDVGFILALLCGAIIVALRLCEDGASKNAVFSKEQLVGSLICYIATLLTPIFSYLSWTIYTSLVFSNNQFVVGGSENLSMVGVISKGFLELFAITLRSERFSAIATAMKNAFSTANITIFGNIYLNVFIALLISFAAGLLSSKQDRLKIIVINITMILGLIGYTFFHLCVYCYVFKGQEGLALADFERYFGIFILAFLLLDIFVAYMFAQKGRISKQLLCFTLLIVFSYQFYLKITPANSFIDFKNNYFDTRKQYFSEMKVVKERIPKNAKLFIVSQGDKGERSLVFTYDAIPVLTNGFVTEFGDTVGTLVLPSDSYAGDNYYIVKSQEQLLDIFVSGFDYVYLQNIDTGFVNDYGDLFSGAPKQGMVYQVMKNEKTLKALI